MFKMQADSQNFKKNVTADKKVYSGKNESDFQNSKSDISCKILSYVFFVINKTLWS